MVNKQFGLKNNFLLVVVGDFAQVALMFELFQYYLSQKKYRDLYGSTITQR